MSRTLRTLLFSTLYPSSARPLHGVFVETRLRELLKLGGVETRVVAPVPWFWSTDPRHGDHAAMARTPRRETLNGIDVLHPRYAVLPKVGMSVAPLFLALGARSSVKKIIDEGFEFDLIDAHYFYPDGVAAALLASWFGKPFVVTARGTDLNLISSFALPAAMIRWTARRASASIGVSSALMEPLRRWKIDESRLHVLRNGVDLNRFYPLPQMELRQALQVRGAPVLLSVGKLIELKGHHLVVHALAELSKSYPNATLCIVGDGPERDALAGLTQRLGVSDRVRLIGSVPNGELTRWYSAADVLILASSREGWANVLLEAMACGTPVVATRVGGTPEVVQEGSSGRLVDRRDGMAFAEALTEILAVPVDRRSVRAYAERFDWLPTSLAQQTLFDAIVKTEVDLPCAT